MIEGIRTSASALSPLMRAQEVLTNNLANVNTPAFRQDRVSFARLSDEADAAVAITGPLVAGNPGLLGQPGAATRGPAVRTHADARPGAFDTTGSPLDLAVRGDAYFVVQTPEGELYTRDGALSRAADGTLLHRSGHPLLSDGGPLVLPEGRHLVVDDSGRVFADAEEIGQIRLVELPDTAGLEHVGSNLVRSTIPGTDAEDAGVVQGSLEQSNVEAVETLVQMMAWMRSFEANQSALLTQDAGLGRLIEWASR